MRQTAADLRKRPEPFDTQGLIDYLWRLVRQPKPGGCDSHEQYGQAAVAGGRQNRDPMIDDYPWQTPGPTNMPQYFVREQKAS